MVFYCGTRYSSVLKVLLELHVLWSHIFISEAASYYVYHICDNSTTYTPKSTYQINLNSLLSTLSSPNITRNNLFYNATAGNSASDRAYGLFICRGDVDIRSCHECVENAAREVVEKCPKEKQAYIWYNECRLRYDNKSFFSTMDVSHRWYMWNEAKVTEPDRLSQVLNNSLSDLAAHACKKLSTTNGGQLKGFAIGETSFINSTLYSLVQCTPDLSEADCNRCLGVAIGLLPSCCWGKQGGKVLLPSCNIRYEMYPFYNIIAAPPRSTVLPPAPRSSKNQRGIGRISAQVIIIIVVAVVVSIFVFTLGFCFLRRRRAKRFDAIQEATDGNEILIAESLQYD